MTESETTEVDDQQIHIAVEGCCHGELDKIYESVVALSADQGVQIELLIICGDFQSVRNENDLACLACPPKYRAMNTFYKYYTGEKVVPVLTLFIGGNHEASNYLVELPYGGWVAPKIYYLGFAGVVRYRGLVISGISGIHKERDYNLGHHEFPPFDQNTMRSVYHIRSLDVFRLLQYKGHVDVFFSHDWPLGIYKFGNTNALLRKKPFFRDEIDSDSLGSMPNLAILRGLKPAYYFAAHLHVKFTAIYPHQSIDPGASERPVNPILEDVQVTRFMALDKVIPGRPFLQLVSLPCPDPAEPRGVLKYDLEWLQILKATDALNSILKSRVQLPKAPLADHLTNTKINMGGDLGIGPEHFERTAPAYEGGYFDKNARQPTLVVNPYTAWFCSKLGIKNTVAEYYNLVECGFIKPTSDPELESQLESSFNSSNDSSIVDLNTSGDSSINPSEIDLDSEESVGDGSFTEPTQTSSQLPSEVEDDETVSIEVSQPTEQDNAILERLTSALDEDRSTDLAVNVENTGHSGPKKFKRRNTATCE